MSLYLDRECGIASRSLKVLHFAPDRGVRAQLENVANVLQVTLDLERTDVDIRADIGSLPFADGSFDLVICSHVLEHVPDDALAMREIARVVSRHEGRALVLVPVDPELPAMFEDASITTREGRRVAFGQEDHVRMFGADVADRFGRSGMSVATLDYAATLPDPVHRVANLQADLIFLCTPSRDEQGK
jgi:SAM-dependent methyltransferase